MKEHCPGKEAKIKIINVKPFIDDIKVKLVDIDTKGIYFQDTPLLGAVSCGNNKWKPHIDILCKRKGEGNHILSLEIIFPSQYTDVYACSTSKDLIRVCLIK